jgi:hypothetical protein
MSSKQMINDQRAGIVTGNNHPHLAGLRNALISPLNPFSMLNRSTEATRRFGQSK